MLTSTSPSFPCIKQLEDLNKQLQKEGRPQCLLTYEERRCWTVESKMEKIVSHRIPWEIGDKSFIDATSQQDGDFLLETHRVEGEVDVLNGSLCWTRLPAWIKYCSWTRCSTLFGNNNILLRVIPLSLCVLTSLTPSSFLSVADSHKHTQTHIFKGERMLPLSLPVNTEDGGEGRKREGKVMG